MAKIKQWWNTPISKMFDDKEHIKYTVIVVVIIVAIIIILSFSARLSVESNTINIQTETIKPVETSVNSNIQNNQSILMPLELIMSGGVFGNKIIMILIAGVCVFFIGIMIRRRMRIIAFVFIQVFCFIAFGLNIWAVIIPFLFLLASIISKEISF